MSDARLVPGCVIGGLWTLGRRIGNGSFGEIYIGRDIETGREAAMKFESCKAKHPQLAYEAKLLRRLQGGEGIAQLYYSGVVEVMVCRVVNGPLTKECFTVMVTELLGPSLEDLFCLCDRSFSLHTLLSLMEQMLRRIEFLHRNLFIHRDIKPENFLLGRNEKSKVLYMIDFGLAKRYQDPRTGEHIPYREDKSLTGTARYASINAHLGIEQSRRDDLEAAGYVMLYFARNGMLPWQGLKASKKQEKYSLIMERKLATPVEVLCQDQPREFIQYLRYCHSLRFTDEPDYPHLRRLLQLVRMQHRTTATSGHSSALTATSAGALADSPADWNCARTTTGKKIRKREKTDVVPFASLLSKDHSPYRPRGSTQQLRGSAVREE
ncbi:casein kinase I [Gregarina niphandrodes]|uniref:Casein kinase I n=1 Tax=Gregarina niphandrodes TaxID=110365 RepID=A0A023BDL2_GRENI|nr:casein kinase I [Gregarina niphandrodes]EZG88609.1 casein kinase I [Gregarina niphandrodes]|eukprot:XP_011128544.1 casein kinase I [Gregarina niphandrodes]